MNGSFQQSNSCDFLWNWELGLGVGQWGPVLGTQNPDRSQDPGINPPKNQNQKIIEVDVSSFDSRDSSKILTNALFYSCEARFSEHAMIPASTTLEQLQLYCEAQRQIDRKVRDIRPHITIELEVSIPSLGKSIYSVPVNRRQSQIRCLIKNGR